MNETLPCRHWEQGNKSIYLFCRGGGDIRSRYLFSQAGSYKPREVNATSPINNLSELLLFKIQYGSLSESLTARDQDVFSSFLEKLKMFHQLQSRPYGLTDKVHLYNAARGLLCFVRGVGIG